MSVFQEVAREALGALGIIILACAIGAACWIIKHRREL